MRLPPAARFLKKAGQKLLIIKSFTGVQGAVLQKSPLAQTLKILINAAV